MSGNRHDTAFVSSFDWCSKYQIIDLLESSYTESKFDKSPKIKISDWITGWPDCGGESYLSITLMDGEKNTIRSYNMHILQLHRDWDNGTYA